MEERKFKYVGTRPIRHDGVDKVTGRANFGADASFPGMLEGAVLRSPHAHARILDIDTRQAEKLPGVHAVITGADLPTHESRGMPGTEGRVNVRDLSENCLARGKARYQGHPVAAVAAVSRDVAEAALDCIHVEYEILPAVMDLDQALADGAPAVGDEEREGDEPSNVVGRMEFDRGDLEAGFAEADVVIEREFSTEMVHQGYIEPHACVARVSEEGQVVLWTSTQGPFVCRTYTSNVLDLDPSKLRVIPSEIGGGFGGKTTIYLEPLAIVLARKTGRPVKLVMSRREVFLATGPTSGARVRVKLGAKRDGTFVAGESVMYLEAGAFAGAPVFPAVAAAFAAYKIPNFRAEGFDVLVNRPKVNAYRAPGAPLSTFGTECVIDELARELAIDPVDLRLHNAVSEGDPSAYGPKYGPIGLIETLQAAKNHPHYKSPLGADQGRGLACGWWINAGMQSSANVSLFPDASAVVSTGNPDIGGSRVSLAIMVAEELGIPVERVRPQVADTDSVPWTDGTGGSRVTFATGMAVIQAAREVVEQLCARAAQIWDVDSADVSWQDGCAVATDQNGSGKRYDPLSILELAKAMASTGGPIAGRASLNAGTAGPSFGTHICDLELDRETGCSRVVRYTVIQDAGKAVHPSYVEGQLQGGAAQGIGWALNEEYVYDSEGQLENSGFLDYRMPVASDLPMIDTVIVEVPNPIHPYGVRGVGETPIVPPLATLANAMSDVTGVRFTKLPMSPPRVLAALGNGSHGGSAG